MKRIGGLFGQICDVREIVKGAHLAALGKRHRRGVRDFLENLDAHAASISSQLVSGEFTFDPYSEFLINDPKSRTIQAPSFRDRVVHHAMILSTGSVFESGATELPLGVPQQEQAGQPQQEHRLPGGLVSWHGEAVPSPDVAPSRALGDQSAGDKAKGKTPLHAEICPKKVKKGWSGAPGKEAES